MVALISEERLIKAGMFDTTAESFTRRVLLIAAASAALAAVLALWGSMENPLYAAVVAVMIPGMYALTPFLNSMNMASKIEKDLWAYLATIWVLQKVGRSVSSSLRAAGSISPDPEAREYFTRAAGRLEGAGTLKGLAINRRLSPSRFWARIYSRLADYLATRGEAVEEMLKTELDESVERSMIAMRQTTERLMMILIIYTLSSTVFPFVMMMMFAFQALVEQGQVPTEAMYSTLLTTLVPTPIFVSMFKIFSVRFFSFRSETVVHGWATAFGVGLMTFAGMFFALDRGILPAQMTIYHAISAAVAAGGLAGWLTIRGEEVTFRGQSFDFPLLLADLFSELRGGRAFGDAIREMKIPYRHLKTLGTKMKAWASLKLPYPLILSRIAEELRYSVSRMSALLIIKALEAGADLEETFATIASFSTRIRELWIETEGTKTGNYLTATVAFLLVLGSYTLLFNVMNLESISQMATESIRGALMMQAVVQTVVMALSLGTVRTGHVTSSLRELAFLPLGTFVMLFFVH